MRTLKFNEGDKFALLAIKNVRSKVRADEFPSTLSDGTSVLESLPLGFDHQVHWAEWLGSLRIDRLQAANVVLFGSQHSAHPEILDQEHRQLDNHLTKVFYVLRLEVVLEYEGADMLLGSFADGESRIRQVSELPGFRPTRGSIPDSVTLESLEKAVTRVSSLESMESELPEYRRVIRGLNTLMDGLRHEHGQDRIHQFVRSLEALILPDIGQTRKQFVHRCQTFAKAGAVAQKALEEAFEMRSDTEHMHDWDRSLQAYPAADRENIALQRTRQTERLACSAYSRILDDAKLRQHFENEVSQSNFWTQVDDRARRASWGRQLDLETIRLVCNYDQWGRAVPQTS